MPTDNISKGFFENYHQIMDGQNNPLTNVYWSLAPRNNNVYGTVYLIHGYGGSPVEPCMKVPMINALAQGFDVVALEGVDLSATAGCSEKQVAAKTLGRQKMALYAGLRFCKDLENINRDYNIGWAHSISCRALSDLMIDAPDVRNYFNELVMNNPYFLPPPKFNNMREKIMKRDPSGTMWHDMMHKVTTKMREIESRKYKIEATLNNLSIPLPPIWPQQNFADLGRRAAHFMKSGHLYFVLGTADHMADYDQNIQIFNGMNRLNKELLAIPGADHSFENALDQYSQYSQSILTAIKSRRANIK